MKNSNDAMAFAIEAMGRDRVDKGGSPYVRHLIAVAAEVDRLTGYDNDEAVQAAILHDTVEDTSVTLDDLRAAGFSREVVRLVDALTKREGEQPIDYWMRIIDHGGWVARYIKTSDALHNSKSERLRRQLTDKDRRSSRFYIGLSAIMFSASTRSREQNRQMLLDNEAKGRA